MIKQIKKIRDFPFFLNKDRPRRLVITIFVILFLNLSSDQIFALSNVFLGNNSASLDSPTITPRQSTFSGNQGVESINSPTINTDPPLPLSLTLANNNSLNTGKLSAPSWSGTEFYWQNSLTGETVPCGATVGLAATYSGDERGSWLPAWSGLNDPHQDSLTTTINYTERYRYLGALYYTRPITNFDSSDGIYYFSAQLTDSLGRTSGFSANCGILIDTQNPQALLIGSSLKAGPPKIYPNGDFGATYSTEELSGLKDIILYYRRLDDHHQPAGEFYQKLIHNSNSSRVTLEDNSYRQRISISQINLLTMFTKKNIYPGYYQFFLQATDLAGNATPWPDDPSTLDIYEVVDDSQASVAYLQLFRGEQEYLLNRLLPPAVFDLKNNHNLDGWLTHPLLNASSFSLQTENFTNSSNEAQTRTFIRLSNHQNNYLHEHDLLGFTQDIGDMVTKIDFPQHALLQTVSASLGSTPHNFYTLAFDYRVKSDQRLPLLNDPLWSLEVCGQKIFNFNSQNLPTEKDSQTGLYTQDWQRIYLNLAVPCQATAEEIRANYKSNQLVSFSWGEQLQPEDILEIDLANFNLREILTTSSEKLILRSTFDTYNYTNVSYQQNGETIELKDQNYYPLVFTQALDNNGQINFYSRTNLHSRDYLATGSPFWLRIDDQNPPQIIAEKSSMRGEKLDVAGQKYLCRANLALVSDQSQPVFITGQFINSTPTTHSTDDQPTTHNLTTVHTPADETTNDESSKTISHFSQQDLPLARLGENHLQSDNRWLTDWRRHNWTKSFQPFALSSLVTPSGQTQDFWFEWQPTPDQVDQVLIQVWGQSLSHDSNQSQIIFNLKESCLI